MHNEILKMLKYKPNQEVKFKVSSDEWFQGRIDSVVINEFGIRYRFRHVLDLYIREEDVRPINE